MHVLGISCYFHDSAAALVSDGQVVAAAEEERYTRVKHDRTFPLHAAQDCLAIGGITVKDLDAVVFYEQPLAKLERMLWFGKQENIDRSQLDDSLARFLDQQTDLVNELHSPGGLGYTGQVLCCDHHQSHMASTYAICGQDHAALLTLDGVGEWTTSAIGRGKEGKVEMLEQFWYPHSIGLFYSTWTAWLGFKINNDEYKVMGLAAYGEPKYVDRMKEVMTLHDDGHYELNIDLFDFHRRTDRMYSDAFLDAFGPARKIEAQMTQFYADMAASVQKYTEQAIMGLARRAVKEAGSKHICLAGGVALNCLANQVLHESGEFDSITIQPAAGDDGGSVGAALWGASHLGETKRPPAVPHYDTCLGPEFTESDIQEVLDRYGALYRRYDSIDELAEKVAEVLSRGLIVGWFQGRMEFGPRALGCRSILASPLKADMKDVINRRIKFREPFRPFAPVSTIEDANRFFEVNKPYPYMLMTCKVRPEHYNTLPAITHEDGTARLQTTTKEMNYPYHAVIKHFGEKTGVPVLVNTSFNVRGEPIVRTPEDAYRCFMLTDIDALAVGPFLCERLW